MSALSITATAVIKSSVGTSATGILGAGVTATQGQALCITASTGKLALADANDTAANNFAGMSLSAGSPGQTIAFCPADSGAFINGASGMTVGGAIYVGNTPGAITQTLADATGGTSILIGTALSATTQTVIAGGIIGGTVA
jgi:hypothetical protein